MYSLEREARSVTRGAETVVLITRRKILLRPESPERENGTAGKADRDGRDAEAPERP